MRLGVLGPLEIVDGALRRSPSGRRQAELLAMLVLAAGAPVALDRLLTEIWGEDAAAGAVASLYTHVSNLRRLLGKDRIARDGSGYRLALRDGDEVDVTLFEAAAADARRRVGSDPAAAAAGFEAALRLWRGRPYEGLEDVAALSPEIARLEELEASVRVERLESLLRSGAVPDVGDARDVCERFPYDERGWELLIRTLYRNGRPADAARAYREVVALLDAELGVEPSAALRRLEEQVLLHDPALDGPGRPPAVGLPTYLTTFVDRTAEQRVLAQALADHRLVTLTGPGGVGKTRLAVEVAASLTARYLGGIWLVDLARLSDDDAVGPAVTATLGASGGAARGMAAAAAILAGRPSLLVLDNCEHVVGAARRAAKALLDQAPSVTVLATSRVVLGLLGEHRIRLAGLAVSAADGAPGDAIALFRDRAGSQRATWDDGGAGATAVERICRRLDGIPLAVELAASRVGVLSPSEIADLLARRFGALADDTRERAIHRSLEATIGWSHALLDPEQRAAFAALGIFEGPFSIEAAGAVLGADDGSTIAMLDGLANASLLSVDARPEGPGAYRLLDTLRSYARDRLLATEGWEAAAARHDRFYRELAVRNADDLLVRARPGALRRIAEAERELVAAWDRMLPEDPIAVLPIGWALASHWSVSGGIEAGERRIRGLLDLTAGDESGWRLFTLSAGALLADRRGSVGTARRWSNEAIQRADRLGDPGSLIVALNFGGQLRVDRGDLRKAIALLDRSLDVLARLERDESPPTWVRDGAMWARLSRAEARRWLGGTGADVRRELYEVRRHFVETNDPEGEVRVDRVLVTIPEVPLSERRELASDMVQIARADGGEGFFRFEAARAGAALSAEAGDPERASALNRAAVRAALAGGSISDLGSALLFAGTLAARSDPRLAARLVGIGERFAGSKPGPQTPVDIHQTVELVRSHLGATVYREIHRIGAAMAVREAAALVL